MADVKLIHEFQCSLCPEVYRHEQKVYVGVGWQAAIMQFSPPRWTLLDHQWICSLHLLKLTIDDGKYPAITIEPVTQAQLVGQGERENPEA